MVYKKRVYKECSVELCHMPSLEGNILGVCHGCVDKINTHKPKPGYELLVAVGWVFISLIVCAIYSNTHPFWDAQNEVTLAGFGAIGLVAIVNYIKW
jgi:hypothetical protein